MAGDYDYPVYDAGGRVKKERMGKKRPKSKKDFIKEQNIKNLLLKHGDKTKTSPLPGKRKKPGQKPDLMQPMKHKEGGKVQEATTQERLAKMKEMGAGDYKFLKKLRDEALTHRIKKTLKDRPDAAKGPKRKK